MATYIVGRRTSSGTEWPVGNLIYVVVAQRRESPDDCSSVSKQPESGAAVLILPHDSEARAKANRVGGQGGSRHVSLSLLCIASLCHSTAFIPRNTLRSELNIEDTALDKQMMSVQEVAELLTEAALKAGLEAFPEIAESVLEDNSPGEIAAIGQFLEPALRELLPKRVLH